MKQIIKHKLTNWNCSFLLKTIVKIFVICLMSSTFEHFHRNIVKILGKKTLRHKVKNVLVILSLKRVLDELTHYRKNLKTYIGKFFSLSLFSLSLFSLSLSTFDKSRVSFF
jgi:hypothetical protein